MRILHRNGFLFFQHLTVSWSLLIEMIISLKLMCYARRYKLGSEKSQSSDCCGFTDLLYKSLKCHEAYFFERIKQLAEEAIGSYR